MQVGLRLFLSSGAFAIVIDVAYWLLAREPAGPMLSGFLAFALSFIAGYMIVAEREADLWGDDANATNTEAAGEVVGTYSIRSPLPIASAAALTCVGLGLVVSPTIAALGIIASVSWLNARATPADAWARKTNAVSAHRATRCIFRERIRRESSSRIALCLSAGR